MMSKDIAGLTGEQIGGDLLAATIWNWFAASESQNRISQSLAGMIENPGLSYGLIHAVVNPYYSWGVIRKVTFPGINMDIGHVRNLSWSKDNDDKNWIAYNRLRGQYMSALEHAIPERFLNDSTLCNLVEAPSPNTSLPTCPQGISAVKAIALAGQAGQKVLTISRQVYQDNPSIVTTRLSAHSHPTQDRVQEALDAGYEVTIHEAPVTQDGWTGAGFTMIDPSTGAGGYLIEGGANGGFLAFTFLFALLGVVSLFFFGASIFALWMVFAALGSALHFLNAADLDADFGAALDYGGLLMAALGILSAIGTGSALLGLAILGLIYALVTVIRNLWMITFG